MSVARRHPEWIKVKAPSGQTFFETKRLVSDLRLHTVCEEAHCPNVGECWGHRTATFMLLGDVCTRNCGFCAVTHGRPQAVDPGEPARVAEGVSRLGLRHVVVTSVDRDDLPDGGAEHFARTAEAIKASLQILGNSLMELKTLQSPADSGMLGTVASPEIPPAAAVEKAE